MVQDQILIQHLEALAQHREVAEQDLTVTPLREAHLEALLLQEVAHQVEDLLEQDHQVVVVVQAVEEAEEVN